MQGYLFNYIKVHHSSTVHIGNVALGGKNPVRIQSMTTTNTMDTNSTVAQVKNLALAGCDYVRITAQNIKEAKNLKNIKNELRKVGVDIPLIADVHFNPKVAEAAARIVEKVRINPGNYIDAKEEGSLHKCRDGNYEIETIRKKLSPLLNICKEHGTAIRIGVNQGSLSERILYKYGNTARGMVESIMEFVSVCSQNEFHNLVLSLKSGNVATMIEANMLMVDRLTEAGLKYPIHLGVTEAGSEEEGRIKSAAGIGYLLAHGIGDTIRVSLTEDPLDEIPVALKIVEFFGRRKNLSGKISFETINFLKNRFSVMPPVVVTTGFSSFSDLSIERRHLTELCQANEESISVCMFSYPGISYNDLIIKSAVESTIILLRHGTDGIWIENGGATSPDSLAKLALNILQVLGMRTTKTEYIACPTCGRSTINVIRQLEKVKEQTSHLPGLKIAVMGCAVNGPGEMAGAHYGCVGTMKGKVNIYKGSDVVQKNVPEEMVVDALINLIKDNGEWKDVL